MADCMFIKKKSLTEPELDPVARHFHALILQFKIRTVFKLCSVLQRSLPVAYTAASYLHRLWVKVSLSQLQSPANLLGCIYVACKVEEEYVVAPVLLAEVERITGISVSLDELLSSEALVLATLQFRLLVRTPHLGLVLSLRQLSMSLGTRAEILLPELSSLAEKYLLGAYQCRELIEASPQLIAASVVFLAGTFYEINGCPSEVCQVYFSIQLIELVLKLGSFFPCDSKDVAAAEKYFLAALVPPAPKRKSFRVKSRSTRWWLDLAILDPVSDFLPRRELWLCSRLCRAWNSHLGARLHQDVTVSIEQGGSSEPFPRLLSGVRAMKRIGLGTFHHCRRLCLACSATAVDFLTALWGALPFAFSRLWNLETLTLSLLLHSEGIAHFSALLRTLRALPALRVLAVPQCGLGDAELSAILTSVRTEPWQGGLRALRVGNARACSTDGASRALYGAGNVAGSAAGASLSELLQNPATIKVIDLTGIAADLLSGVEVKSCSIVWVGPCPPRPLPALSGPFEIGQPTHVFVDSELPANASTLCSPEQLEQLWGSL
eukprot:RCo051358